MVVVSLRINFMYLNKKGLTRPFFTLKASNQLFLSIFIVYNL